MGPEILTEALGYFQSASPDALARVAPILLPWYVALFTLEVLWTTFRQFAAGAERLLEVLLPKFLVGVIGYGLIILLPIWLRPFLEGWDYLGQLATGLPGITPDALIEQGLVLANSLFDSWGEFASLFTFGQIRLLAAFILLASYVAMALALCLILVEASLYVGGLPVMLLFAGHSATFGIAEGYLRGLFHLGIRVFVLYLFLGAAASLGAVWNTRISLSGAANPLVNIELLAAAVLLAIAAWSLPNRIAERLAPGFSFSGNNPLSRG